MPSTVRENDINRLVATSTRISLVLGPLPLCTEVQQARLWERSPRDQAPVVQKVDNAIHRINHYPVGSVVCFVNIYPLDSDLSGG